MTTARLRTATHEVWQYTLDYRPLWVERCIEGRVEDGIYELYLVRRSGKQRILPGEWLIRDLDGDPEWVDDDTFQREYEVINPT